MRVSSAWRWAGRHSPCCRGTRSAAAASSRSTGSRSGRATSASHRPRSRSSLHRPAVAPAACAWRLRCRSPSSRRGERADRRVILIASGVLGLASVLAIALAIDIDGWTWPPLASLFGPLPRRQPGLGYGAFGCAAASLVVACIGTRAARLRQGRRVRRRRDRRVGRARRRVHAVSAAAPASRARSSTATATWSLGGCGRPLRVEQGLGRRRRRVEYAAARPHDRGLGDAARAVFRAGRHAHARCRDVARCACCRCCR